MMHVVKKLLAGDVAQRIASNASWLMVERLITMLVNLAIGVLLARYLGPSDYGTFNFALALVALLGFLSYLGLDSTVSRRLKDSPEERPTILGTAFLLKLGGSFLAVSLATAYALLADLDWQTRLMIPVIAAGLVFQPATVVDFYFQSRMLSRYSAVARTIASLATSGIKLALILLEADLVAFAFAAGLQNALIAFAFVLAFRKHRDFAERWRWSSMRARELMRASWPLALSAASGLIYLKIDQVMLGEIVGDAEVGIYSVAVRLSEVWWFIPTALGATFLPVLVESKQAGELTYRRRLQRMYDIMVWAGVAVAVPIVIIAHPAITLLYGPDYQPAATMLQIHVLSSPAMFVGAVLARWSVMEGQELFTLFRNVVAAIMNVALNMALIPTMGGIGAAIATLISYTATSYLAALLYSPARSQFVHMIAAIALPMRLFRRVTR